MVLTFFMRYEMFQWKYANTNMNFVETWRTSWHIMKKTRCSSNNCERHTKQQKTYYSQNLLEAMQNYENPCF